MAGMALYEKTAEKTGQNADMTAVSLKKIRRGPKGGGQAEPWRRDLLPGPLFSENALAACKSDGLAFQPSFRFPSGIRIK